MFSMTWERSIIMILGGYMCSSPCARSQVTPMGERRDFLNTAIGLLYAIIIETKTSPAWYCLVCLHVRQYIFYDF